VYQSVAIALGSVNKRARLHYRAIGADGNDARVPRKCASGNRREFPNDKRGWEPLPSSQEVARRIGRDRMKQWIDTLGYGNRDISGPIDSFWLNNRMKIKPDEELGLVKKLYFNQLPFFKSTQETVQSVMLREQNTNYKLSYKTGWGNLENGHGLGWIVGWIEENRHPYFFVLNIESANSDNIPKVRIRLLRDILAHLGFFNGKK